MFEVALYTLLSTVYSADRCVERLDNLTMIGATLPC